MKLKDHLGEWYKSPLRYEFSKQYMKKVNVNLRVERSKHDIVPDSDQVFRAFRMTSLEETKVVILGQDPYPHEHANGLAFSSNESLDNTPKSLQNIFKEVEDDVGFQPYHDTDLTRWAKQGVLLLNRTLTVRKGFAGSHYSLGWQRFTDKAIELVCQKEQPVVFILWGREAQYVGHKIPHHHHIIYGAHPSPYSANRGFFGTKPFSRTNEFLENNNYEPIDWLNYE